MEGDPASLVSDKTLFVQKTLVMTEIKHSCEEEKVAIEEIRDQGSQGEVKEAKF